MAITSARVEPYTFLNQVLLGDTETERLTMVAVLMRILLVGGPAPNNPMSIGATVGLSRTKTARSIETLVAKGHLRLVDGNLLV